MTTILTIVAVIVLFVILFKVFKLLIRLILVAVFLLIAYFTNPGPGDHERAVTNKARQTNSTMADKRVEVDDYKVFSLTYVDTKDDEDERLIGAGAFTQVFIFRKP